MTVSSKHQRQLDEEGYVVIPEVLSVAEIASYRARLLELAAAERADGSGRVHSEGRGQHVRWLVNKGREFERLVAHPRVVPYFEHLLGPDYTLSTLTSNLIYPGAADHPFHIDNALSAMPEPLPSFPMFVNSLWLLDDFTPENGGTRFVPGSHRWLQKPPPAGAPQALGHPDEVRLRAPAGSVFLFNGATWHATGSNETDEARVCLICFCCRSFLKPMFDFVRHIEPAVAARATGEMRRIYGFDSQPQGPDVAEGQAR
ncbi:phytanoyl-CoA dioxygenase family protein [bacterium]|nr:phytanoyl-CoA dioxygenase family protein [bacterium]